MKALLSKPDNKCISKSLIIMFYKTNPKYAQI